MLVLSVFPWETNKVNNAFKYLIPMCTKSSITNVAKNGITGKFLGFLGTLKRYILVFLFSKCFYLLFLLIFFLFQIKTSGFHLKEEGKELLGMLIAALANNNGYYVLYLFLLSFFK